jgi:hypothetical protein
MDEMGKMSPESSTWGRRIIKASWIAWPWFCETLEISTPIPSVTNKNSSAPNPRTSTEPRNGMSNKGTPTPRMRTISRAATRK